MDLLKDMGKRFREIREEKGYSVRDTAKWVAVSEPSISRIEQGDYMPPWSVYEDICRVLGTTFSEFMSVYRWTYTDPQKMLMEVDFNENYRRVS